MTIWTVFKGGVGNKAGERTFATAYAPHSLRFKQSAQIIWLTLHPISCANRARTEEEEHERPNPIVFFPYSALELTLEAITQASRIWSVRQTDITVVFAGRTGNVAGNVWSRALTTPTSNKWRSLLERPFYLGILSAKWLFQKWSFATTSLEMHF